MKKLIVIGAIFILILSTTSFAFQNEPDGFRGLKWGDPPMEGMKYIREIVGSKGYVLPDDRMFIGDAELCDIIYLFYGQPEQFESVSLYYKGKSNYYLLETICKERFGEDELREGFYDFTWSGQKALIILSYDIIDNEGYLSISSMVITLENIAAEKQKQAEKAEGDF